MPALLLRLVGEPRGFGKFVEVSAAGGPGPFFIIGAGVWISVAEPGAQT